MPLFECSQCHVVDNTALTEFWWNVMREGHAPLCSQCDPEIGKWLGSFPRTNVEEYKRQFGGKSVEYDAAMIAKLRESGAIPQESKP